MSKEIKPVILCGGFGTRLWPISRESYPKQFVPMVGKKSLLERTLLRIEPLANPIYIANEEHRYLINDIATSTLGHKTHTILLEPAAKNTSAAMALAVNLPNLDPSDLLLFLPSDHFIPDSRAFIDTINLGVDVAEEGFIVTFGVQPTFPSTAYGYIQKGIPINEYALSVASFFEKPVFEKAQEMLLNGEYLWNAGIFLCRASVLIDALSKHAPDILQCCEIAMRAAKVDGNFVRPNNPLFLDCRSESIDYAVMEHYDKVAVIPFNGAWSDVGSWNALAALSPGDEFGNHISGQGLTFQSNNTYINAPHRPVVALGVSDLVIVDTPDAVLVASADKVEQVKEVVAQLKKDDIAQAVMHRRVARPWGWYDSIDAGDRFQVKRITVKRGASLSLQMHHHRAEHWVVVKGTAKVTNGEKVFILKEDQSTYIPVGSRHRLENFGETDLEIIEVQSGDYLGEDDIVRFDDTYGRS